jgi:hypothetical protein
MSKHEQGLHHAPVLLMVYGLWFLTPPGENNRPAASH